MRKKFLSSFGKKLIVISLIVSSFISGGLVAGYYLFFNSKENSKPNRFEYIFRSKKIDGQNSPFLYQAAPKDTGIYWLNKKEEDMLIDKIKKELGYGPEFDKLRSITIGDENMTGEDANGVYYPSLNKIYINLENYQKYINVLKNKQIEDISYTSDMLSQIKINLIFETIFHEYGHHMAFSYLTNEGSFSPDQDKTIFLNGKLLNWNKNFTEKFKEYLNYSSDWQGEKYTNAEQTYRTPNGYAIKYKSIGSIYSQEDLFNHANAQKEYDFHEMDSANGVPYLFAGIKKFMDWVPTKIPKEQLSYYYSMDELFTRKYQQLNQIYKPVQNVDSILSGYFGYDLNPIIANGINVVTLSDILHNTLLYQNGFGAVFPKQNQNLELQNFNANATSKKYFGFDDSRTSNRFLYDAPFNNNEYKYFDNKLGNFYNLPDNHIKLYNLMDNFLGHSTGADVSIVWPENNLETEDSDLRKIYLGKKDRENAKTKFKFGGYVKDNQYDSVGYEDLSSNYHELSKITIKDFTYKHKDWLGATEHVNLDSKKENYFYTTNNFIDKNQLLNKELGFKKTDGTFEKLLTVRDDISTGTNSTWYSNFSDILQINQRYSFALDNGSVVFKEIP